MNAPHPWVLPLHVISRARMLPAGFEVWTAATVFFFSFPLPLPVSTCAALLAVPALCPSSCLCVCSFPFHCFHLHFASVLHSRSEITATGTLFLSGFFFCFITPEEMEISRWYPYCQRYTRLQFCFPQGFVRFFVLVKAGCVTFWTDARANSCFFFFFFSYNILLKRRGEIDSCMN